MAKRNDYHRDGPSAEDRALERFTELMIEKISTLKKDWSKPWFTEGMMKWPKNLSGREYNGMNALMLALECEKRGYELPVFCTFDAALSLNYSKKKDGSRQPLVDENGEKLPLVSVQKGEKSFPVFITTFTVVDKETKEKIKYDEYKRLSDEEKQRYNVYPKMNVYNVFNVDQTNLREARPELYEKIRSANALKPPVKLEGESFSFAPLDEMVDKGLWVCPIRPMHQDRAYYSISKDEIVIPEKSQFVDGESYYCTMLHEMTHSSGHESRLNRLKPAAFGSEEYAREELGGRTGQCAVGLAVWHGKTDKRGISGLLEIVAGQLAGITGVLENDLVRCKKSHLDDFAAD